MYLNKGIDLSHPFHPYTVDNLLSYFLGVEQQQNGGNASPYTQFGTTSAAANANHHLPGILHNSRQSQNQQALTSAREPSPTFPSAPSASHSSAVDEDDDDDNDYVPPPTPATQYYHHSSKPKANAGRPPFHDSKSNFPMATFRDDVKNPANRNSSADQTMDNTSPLSPTLMIGAVHEPLMLPPSPQGRLHSSSQPHQPSLLEQQKHQQSANQSHLEWLQHINNLARQAQGGQLSTVSSMPPVPAPTPPPEQPTPVAPLPHPANSINFTGVTGLPMTYGRAQLYLTPAALKHLKSNSPPAESEEKRAKRLQRNRESARKSRQRKKERLSKLEEQVAGLHDKIETIRTEKIKNMNPLLQDFFVQRIVRLADCDEVGNSITTDSLATVFRGTGHNCEVQRAVIDFQYSQLERTLLARYQKFLLWLTLHPESWFTYGREQYAKLEANRQAIRISSGKISSKQVGDELTNGSKTDGDNDTAQKKKNARSKSVEKASQTAEAFDAFRMWPLLCYELSISVDQEERILQVLNQARTRHDMQDTRSHIEAATRMASRLKEAVLLQSRNVAVRGERANLQILNPGQSVDFHKWLANNRERYQDILEQKSGTRPHPAPTLVDDSRMSENMTLIEVCRKLEAVLKISKGEQ